MRRLLIAVLLVAGCGSISPAAGDGGGRDVGAELGQAGHDGGRDVGAELGPEAPVDASDAADDRCAPPAFSCLGVQGGCAAGEEAATMTTCAVAAPICCPVHVCDPAQCHTCTGCP